MIYLVTGWPGAGKSTVAVQHALHRYAYNRRRIVANFPIDFAPICLRPGSVLSSAVVQVCPDRPSRADLDALGEGGDSEERAGMLVIDEAGGWLNSRTWQSKKVRRVTDTGEVEEVTERELIIDWLTQSRKRYWDIYLIAQAPAMLDKQVREAVCEGVVRIRRFDRFRVLGVSMPRVHIAIVRYGLDSNGPVIERWIYRGTEAHRCFGSYRLFGRESRHYSILPARLVKWRGAPVITMNSLGRWMLGLGGLGCVLMLSRPAVGFAILLFFALLAWIAGRDITKPRRSFLAQRFKRATGGGMGAGPHASLGLPAHA